MVNEEIISEIVIRLNRINELLQMHQELLREGLQGEVFSAYEKLLEEEEERVKRIKSGIVQYLKIE